MMSGRRPSAELVPMPKVKQKGQTDVLTSTQPSAFRSFLTLVFTVAALLSLSLQEGHVGSSPP